jgi:hypothetical protein
MKIIKRDQIYEIASAALRCGRYASVLKKRKKLDARDIGWHEGKLYAYSWILDQMGKCEMIDLTKIYEPVEWLQEYRQNSVVLFPNLKWGVMILMKKKFFAEVLEYMIPKHGTKTTEAIEKLCRVYPKK